jgi:nucleoside-triphosphatase
MPNNYFVSGMPKSGKTTLLRKLVDKMRAHGLRVGGFITPDAKSHGARTGFVVEDLETGMKETLAATGIDGPKVAKYHVDVRAFESLAVPILRRASRYDVMVIDEIGRMEMKSTKFGELLADLLESDTPLVASLHRDYIEDYGAWGEVQMLTPSNRGELYLNLLGKVMNYARKAGKPAQAKPAGRAKSAKKGKERAGKKTKAARNAPGKKKKKGKEDIERMTDDILAHHGKHREAKREDAEEVKKEDEIEIVEKTEEEKHEEKEEERNKNALRDWVREHIGV